jgi:phospholipase/lecithinase/hemolysin
MKKLASLVLSLACCTNIFADVPKQVVFFGDSLTDNGNLYKMLKLPKSPPYFQGRFSNGYTWSDDFANYVSHKYNIPSSNYAVGGATALPQLSIIPNLAAEIILSGVLAQDNSNTLFFILMGANDYLDGQPNVDAVTTQVVNTIKNDIELLITAKAKNFVILNLPDLAVTPYAQ